MDVGKVSASDGVKSIDLGTALDNAPRVERLWREAQQQLSAAQGGEEGLKDTSGEYKTPKKSLGKEMALPPGEVEGVGGVARTSLRTPTLGRATSGVNILTQQPASPVSAAAGTAYRPGLSQNDPVGSSRPGLSVRDLGAPMETRTYHLDEDPLDEARIEESPRYIRPDRLAALRQMPNFDGSNPRIWAMQAERAGANHGSSLLFDGTSPLVLGHSVP
ncbi:hypothetical protein Emag_007239 [Eimeria magna]